MDRKLHNRHSHTFIIFKYIPIIAEMYAAAIAQTGPLDDDQEYC